MSLYALRQTGSTPGEFTGREFPVKGASNRDWEDVVYVEEGGGSYLYALDLVTSDRRRKYACSRVSTPFGYADEPEVMGQGDHGADDGLTVGGADLSEE